MMPDKSMYLVGDGGYKRNHSHNDPLQFISEVSIIIYQDKLACRTLMLLANSSTGLYSKNNENRAIWSGISG